MFFSSFIDQASTNIKATQHNSSIKAINYVREVNENLVVQVLARFVYFIACIIQITA